MAATAILQASAATKPQPYDPFKVPPSDPPLTSSLSSSSISRRSRISRLRHSGRAFVAPVVKAQQSYPDDLPDSKFFKVEAILRPWRVPHVSSGLLKMGIRGVTVSDVRGFGSQGGSTERQAGSEFSEDKFVAKVKMEIVVSKDQVEEVIDKIIEEARTGEIGDGKIFGERGEKGEKMTGGRAEMISSSASH
ncbi:hypothetical protein QJS04_geneDACA015858 [Acorus gramineus]|uniref:Nitrogen regulatory protein P-II n=1 Tax=Acorus gramineus TaxID=55184 RepID=A0AAV9BRC6_ACOGR|nr:hypothetical protein QJS04_geneDACA015858 [Acorus gramineus]